MYPRLFSIWLISQVSDNGPVYVVVAAGGEYGSIAGWDIYNGDPGGTLNHANVLLGWGVEAGVKYWIIQKSVTTIHQCFVSLPLHFSPCHSPLPL